MNVYEALQRADRALGFNAEAMRVLAAEVRRLSDQLDEARRSRDDWRAEAEGLRVHVDELELRTEYLLNARPGPARGEFLRRVDLLAEVMPGERRGLWADTSKKEEV